MVALALHWCLFLFSVLSKPWCNNGAHDIRMDTLFPGQQLMDWQEMYSARKAFKMKFFSPKTSNNRYLAIFYSSSTPEDGPVWIANRNNSIPDASGRLVIDTDDASLKILHTGGSVPISKPYLDRGSTNVSVMLHDDGNFVLAELYSDGSVNSNAILWQSFDYPTDTFLPGMKLGINYRTGHQWSLTSWMRDSLPASGVFNLSIDPNGTGQLIMWWHESAYWTSGLLLNASLSWDYWVCYNLTYISTEDEKYIVYPPNICANINSRVGLTLTPRGEILGETFSMVRCGLSLPEGCFKQELPVCKTRQGDVWFQRRENYIFYGVSYRFPENLNLNLFDCQANCSCVAFGSINENGTGCEIWSELRSMVLHTPVPRILYTLQLRPGVRRTWWIWIIIAIAAGVSTIFFYAIKQGKLNIKGKIKKAKKMWKQVAQGRSTSSTSLIGRVDDKTIHLFSLDSIIEMTNNFSEANKLGEGGFGPVYKGMLPCGQEVAIKRLA